MDTITIDDVEYQLSDLSADAKAQLESLRATDQKIMQTKQDLAILQTARNTYAVALKEMLPTDSTDSDSD